MITYNNTIRIDTLHENLHQRLDFPLSQLGFSVVHDSPDSLVYSRGSWLKNYIAMSPKSWHTTIKIANNGPVDKRVFIVDYKVSTEGQLPLQKEKAYFEQEFALVQQLLNNEEPSGMLEQQAQDAKKTNYQLLVAIVIISVVVSLILVAGLFALFAK